MRSPLTAAALGVFLIVSSASSSEAQAITHVPGTTTRDIAFTSHDGFPMLGRLTLPDTPGRHPVLMLVQNAEAQTKDGQVRLSGMRARGAAGLEETRGGDV